MIIDAHDIFRAFKKWLMAGDPNEATPLLDAALTTLEQAKSQLWDNEVISGGSVIQAQSEKRSQTTIFLVAIPRDPAI
jgi:hypothetical protein